VVYFYIPVPRQPSVTQLKLCVVETLAQHVVTGDYASVWQRRTTLYTGFSIVFMPSAEQYRCLVHCNRQCHLQNV